MSLFFLGRKSDVFSFWTSQGWLVKKTGIVIPFFFVLREENTASPLSLFLEDFLISFFGGLISNNILHWNYAWLKENDDVKY